MKDVIIGIYVLVLVCAVYQDIRKRQVSDYVHIAVLFLAAVLKGVHWFMLLEGIALAVPVLVIAVRTDAIGGGDIKFIFANTWMLGISKTYAGMVIAFGILSFQYLLTKVIKKNSGIRNKEIPLLPYLVTGFLMAVIL